MHKPEQQLAKVNKKGFKKNKKENQKGIGYKSFIRIYQKLLLLNRLSCNITGSSPKRFLSERIHITYIKTIMYKMEPLVKTK